MYLILFICFCYIFDAGMKKLLAFQVLLLYFVSFVFSQQVTVKGKVVDSKTKQSLAFVNITDENGSTGTYTDVDGLFKLELPEKECCLKVSYVGYEDILYKIDYKKDFQLIKLKIKPFELDEVVILPEENPAHRIINLAIENINKNNPKNLKEFSYTSYDKMVVTVDAPELLKKNDEELDSTELSFKKTLNKHDLFLMESVIKRNYLRPGYNQEKVLATKASGFKDPAMVFMISKLQSASFYDPQIEIIGKKYVNPISKGSLNKYFFLLEDTLFNQKGDTTFIISFTPKSNRKFDGLKGFVYINSDGWAIQNVKAETVKDTSDRIITIEQSYEKVDSVWFPYQLKTEIILKNLQIDIGGKKYPAIAKGTNYIKDINLSPGLRKRDFGLYEVEVEPDANSKKDNFWNKYRNDSLSKRDIETYRVIDSLGKASNFDRKLAFLQSAMTGKIPIGPVSIDMNKLFRYNVYEGVYLGLGIHTNRKFSKKIRFGGFIGYGFGDKKVKYGADVSWKFHKPTASVIFAEYYNKPLESGGVSFFDDKDRELSPENFGDFFVERKNLTQGAEIDYSFRLRPIRDFKWNVGFLYQQKEAYRDYLFSPMDLTEIPQVYLFSKITMGFRFAFHEKIIQTTKGNVVIGSKYPVVSFKYTQGLTVLKSNFAFSKFDLRVKDRVETKYFGDFIYNFNAGWVIGDIPATDLYALRGTYRVFTLYAPNTFGTMKPNEFLSDRYASVFLTWDFKDLLLNIGKWKPRLLLLTNIGIGSLKNPEHHLNYDFKTMEKGFFESGFIIRKLINIKIIDLGAGIMYRYGPYSFSKIGENFTYKFSIYYGF